MCMMNSSVSHHYPNQNIRLIFREFVVHEFGNKVCGEAKNMEIGQ